MARPFAAVLTLLCFNKLHAVVASQNTTALSTTGSFFNAVDGKVWKAVPRLILPSASVPICALACLSAPPCQAANFVTADGNATTCEIFGNTVRSGGFELQDSQKGTFIEVLTSCGSTSTVDGGWSNWAKEGQCSSMTGEGVQLRTRECSNPSPNCNGMECQGNTTRETTCHAIPCRTWSNWTDDVPEYGDSSNAIYLTQSRECENSTVSDCIPNTCEGESHREHPCEPGECKPLRDIPSVTTTGVHFFDVLSRRVPIYLYVFSNGKVYARMQGRGGSGLNFNRTWEEYRRGFGRANGEMWIGNEILHEMMQIGGLKIKVTIWSSGGKKQITQNNVHITEESDGFRFTSTSTSPSGMDSLQLLSGMKFSTFDRDNDASASTNCARQYGGGWWFKDCNPSNLNGKYYNTGEVHDVGQGIVWESIGGRNVSHISSKMEIYHPI